MAKTVLIDAGPLVAIINKREQHHEWAVHEARKLDPPFHTCEAVISEAHFLLERYHGGRRNLSDMVEAGRVVLSFSYADHMARVNELMRIYENVPMSFADACLVRMTERMDESEVFSTDSDFQVYRTRGDEPIAVRLPGAA